MQISKKQVEHMAGLARLSLSEDEKVKFASEFSEILGYVEKLNALPRRMTGEVDVKNIKPLTEGLDLVNKVRKDEITRESGKEIRDRLVKLAPEHTEEYIETISPFAGNPK